MASTQDTNVSGSRPRSRKSIAHFPTSELGSDKENPHSDRAASVETRKGNRKGRSKSVGPGGIIALQEDSGNRQKVAATPQYKSILKPTIALSPPKPIPPHSKSRKQSPKRQAEGLLIDVSSPRRRTPQEDSRASAEESRAQCVEQRSPSRIPTPNMDQNRVAVRTEEEQQAVARKELLARKDARRKSLANRRVSFAPEATLHTWDVVEMPEDSTTSSASGNSTRRGSTISGAAGSPYRHPASPMLDFDASEPPSTPPEQLEEVQVKASPAAQRDLHQKKRRRSSGIPPMNFNNPDDFSSSPCSETSLQSDNTSNTIRTADSEVDSSDSDDRDLVEDETITRVDEEEHTGHSLASSNTGSSARLEAALQQAAQQAGTQRIGYDENVDMSMEMADDAVTAAFQPLVQRGNHLSIGRLDAVALLDQEDQNPFSPAFKASASARQVEAERDDTMDFTQAIGQILPQQTQNPLSARTEQKSVAGGRRKSVQPRRRSSEVISDLGEETMDFTAAVGTIQRTRSSPKQGKPAKELESGEEDEEMTMDFTGVIGGVLDPKSRLQIKSTEITNDQLAQQQLLSENSRRQSGMSATDDDAMDMTLAGGRILRPPLDKENDTENITVTKIPGSTGLLQSKQPTDSKANLLAEQEIHTAHKPFSPRSMQRSPAKRPGGRRTIQNNSTGTSEAGSPSLVSEKARKPSTRNAGNGLSTTSQQPSGQATPTKKPSTPSKQLTPNNIRPITPGKTPPLKNVAMRAGSPKKLLFPAEMRQDGSPAKQSTKEPHDPIFGETMSNGVFTPSVVLKPRRRRSSGLGADKEGLGSPNVAAILDRRSSIGESCAVFQPRGQQAAGILFEDPRIMEKEVDAEAALLHHAESGRAILEQEANNQDMEEERHATTNLKDMIQSMTPQKKPNHRGRKSLHIGAAKGLLGKRPAELDESDNDSTPKRLKGRQASPVKSIKLPAPPSKIETTGRKSSSSRLSLKDTSGNANASTPTIHISPVKGQTITTPNDQLRFKYVEDTKSPPKFQPCRDQTKAAEDMIEPNDADERIQLQDFLNMTSIRFMELTTTKRRHTVAPSEHIGRVSESGNAKEGEDFDLENRVVAGACTVPMLELYQHSCRELKKYISEGRSVVKEIEADTFEENPPLFREYMTATPDIKALMDVQFKNVKTHARLLSKARWYEWRMKLLDGLEEGLVKISQGLESDAQNLDDQDTLVQPALESLTHEHERLEDQVQIAQERVDELASYDQDGLKETRESLIAVEHDLNTKQTLLYELQSELNQKEQHLELTLETKEEYRAQSQEADRVMEECRGWDSAEVRKLQDTVSKLENTSGWSILSASSATLTMTYRSILQLFFHPPAFNTSTTAQENAPISLTYLADTHEYRPEQLTTEKRFFLQMMRARLQCLQQPTTSIPSLLHFVASSWASACSVADQARLLDSQFITTSSILSDEKFVVHATILLREMITKVEVGFEVNVKNMGGVEAMEMRTTAIARVVYGERLKEKMMGEFLEKKIGQGKKWVEAVEELEEKLRARGRK